MKTLVRIYDFVTGGSIVAPIGLAIAIGVARFGAAPFFGVLLATFVASTFERVR